jgi:tetratricopeptide (TPR) repeat protein
MTENTQQSTPEGTRERTQKFDFNKIVAILIAVVTLFTAVIAYLQSDAGGRDDQANRDGMRYVLEAFGNQVSGDARVNFDYNVAYQAFYEYGLLASSTANRDDQLSSENYARLSDEMTRLSPMLAAPYFDKAVDPGPKVAAYEADTYLVKITSLLEKFTAASAVKEGWDFKANTYIVHLTLLAVSLFLFGLSTTISNNKTRWIFSGGGSVIAVIAVIWAIAIYAKPVLDLREQGNAIDKYAAGVGLAHQAKYKEAIAEFDGAIAAYPKYANALADRAEAQSSLGNFDLAIADYESAIAAGDTRSNTAGMLAYQYHLVGDFEKAAAMDRKAIGLSPDELWLKYDLGLNLMLGGKLDEGLAVYQDGINYAISKVAEAKAAGKETPSYLWYGLNDGADMLDTVLVTIDNGAGQPPFDKIIKPEEVRKTGEALLFQLKSTAAGLEYTGKAPEGQLAATISPFSIVVPVKDEDGKVVDTSEPGDTFEYGIDEFSVQFDYSNMPEGKDVLFKLYINGTEDPSWRILEPWTQGAEGKAEIPVSYAYSDTFVFDPGEYIVEMYVDYHLAQRGWFTISEKK